MDQLSQGITITVIATLFLVLVAVGIVILILVYQKKQVAFQKEKEREIMASRLEAQEQTFREVSQEIHDNIGQALTLIKININNINIGKSEEALERLATSKTLLTAALKDLRDLSRSLSADFIHDIGLIEALQQQSQLLQRSGNYTVRLHVNGTPYKLPAPHEHVVFRIVQELFTNIVKHAAATSVTISVNYQEHKLVIKVQDDGKGFDSSGHATEAGLGLRNMHNRAKLINGIISYESAPQKGTTATIELSR